MELIKATKKLVLSGPRSQYNTSWTKRWEKEKIYQVLRESFIEYQQKNKVLLSAKTKSPNSWRHSIDKVNPIFKRKMKDESVEIYPSIPAYLGVTVAKLLGKDDERIASLKKEIRTEEINRFQNHHGLFGFKEQSKL